MKAAIEASSTEQRLDADYVFHGTIIHTCGNRVFDNLYRTMREFMKMEINFARQDISTLSDVPLHHEKLLVSVVDGDFQVATTRFRHHIRNIDHLLESKLSAEND